MQNSNGADSEPVLTLQETQEILAKILERIRGVALKHSRAGQHIKQQIEQQGQSMPEAEIFRQFILPHFENAIQEIQDAVLEVRFTAFRCVSYAVFRSMMSMKTSWKLVPNTTAARATRK